MGLIRQIQASSQTTAVALVTTAETLIITSPPVEYSSGQPQAIVICWGQLTTGVGTTTVTPRIRRGNLVTGPLIGLANAENVKVAAGGTEPFFIMLTELPPIGDLLQYSFTLQQAAATGNGSCIQASIAVLLY